MTPAIVLGMNATQFTYLVIDSRNGQTVGKASTLGRARRIRDLKDPEHGLALYIIPASQLQG